jgi:hypothetical protein
MNYVETDVHPAIDVIDASPTHCAVEDSHAPAETTGVRAGIMRKVARCAIPALLSIVIILSWHIYSYRQIVHLMQRTLDQHNTLLDNAIETRMPTDLSRAY